MPACPRRRPQNPREQNDLNKSGPKKTDEETSTFKPPELNGNQIAADNPQIASRFEQVELPVWTESEELRRFIAGYLAMLPVRKDPAAIDQRFVEYLLALTDGVTGRIIDLLRRAAADALTHKSKTVGLDELMVAGASLPAIINQRRDFPI
jgi:hypothetical protein